VPHTILHSAPKEIAVKTSILDRWLNGRFSLLTKAALFLLTILLAVIVGAALGTFLDNHFERGGNASTMSRP
jgi:hypothetical protein